MSIDLEPSEPEIRNRVFGRIYTVTRDGKAVAYCAFTDENFKRLMLAAPDLFSACDALLKAMQEIDLLSAARKQDLENCSDLSIFARLVADRIPTEDLDAALEQVLEACMKARGESCQEDNES